MIRSALLLCAGLIAAACFACAVVPVAQTPPPPPPKLLATCPDGSAFHSHVAWLSNFEPSNNGNPTKAPSAGDIAPLNPVADAAYISDLEAVFSIAPVTFRRDLCALDGIFLDTASCQDFASCTGHSWGYRLRDESNPGKKGRYVAIPASFWNLGGGFRQYTYRTYEKDLLVYTFGWTGDSAYNPTYVVANAEADTFPMTILAALAHETGHIRWYDVVDVGRNGKPDYSQVNTGCNGNDFFLGWVKGGSVGAAGLQSPPTWTPPKWREFLTRAVRHGHPNQKVTPVHAAGPQINDIDGEIAAGDIIDAAFALDQIYSSGAPWATYFAALSPDEDFVESYKFNVLTQCTFSGNGAMDCSNAVLNSLNMQIKNFQSSQPYSKNVPADFVKSKKGLLATKIWCVATVPPFAGRP
jgi:hypothetical protein